VIVPVKCCKFGGCWPPLLLGMMTLSKRISPKGEYAPKQPWEDGVVLAHSEVGHSSCPFGALFLSGSTGFSVGGSIHEFLMVA